MRHLWKMHRAGTAALVSGALAAGALAGGAALGQSEEALIEQQDERQILTDDLIGMNVYGRNTQSDSPDHIGTVESLLLDESNRLTGVVITFGGFLGFGAKKVAVDWEAIEMRKFSETNYGAFVEMTREQIEEAPEFKSLARVKAEEAAERERQQLEQQQQQQQGSGTGTGGATGTGTGTAQ